MNSRRRDSSEDAHSSAEIETFVESTARVSDDGLGPWWRFWKRRRYVFVILLFLGDMTKAIVRTNLSVAVLPMTENCTATNENGTEIFIQDFDWDAKTRGMVLRVFFYGLVSSQMIGGLLAVKYGGFKLYGLGVLVTSATTLLTPAAANVHLYLLLSLRVFEGACEGILAPSQELLLSRWIPTEERNSLVGVTATGVSWGDMASTAICSVVGYHWGWSAIFYTTGCVGIVWFCAWLAIVKEQPMQDKQMSISELAYIQKSLGKVQRNHKTARKLYICGCLTIMAVFSFLIQKVATQTSVLGCLLVMHACLGVIRVQMIANIMDIAPTYSSVLVGLLQTTALLVMFAPSVTGYLTQNKTSEEWQVVFSIIAGINLLGAAVYGLLGSGQLQPWAITGNKSKHSAVETT